MPSNLSRRQVLGGLGLATVGTVAYGADRLWTGATDASFASWTAESGTWPLARYDSANTANNPFATPPRAEPTRHRVLSPDGERYTPLVSEEHLVLYQSGLYVYPRGEESPVWSDDRSTPVAGFGPSGDLYGMRERESTTGEAYTVFCLNLSGGPSESFSATYEEGHVDGFVVGRDELYAGTVTSRDLTAFSPGSNRTWQVDGTMPALADSRLYTAGGMGDGLAAYDERSGLDRALEVGPERRWTAEEPRGEPHHPAVADGRVVVGTYGITDPAGSIGAIGADSGDRLWEPRDFGMDASTPALSGTTGFVAAGTDGLERGLVAALDLPTGETIWRDDVDWYAFSPVVGGQTLVVAGEVRAGDAAPAGTVRAYDTTSGEVLWTVTDEFDPDTVALVGDRVLVGAADGVYEYR